MDVESADDPESSYAVALKTPRGRIYCFYNFNVENRRWVHADNPPFADGKCYRLWIRRAALSSNSVTTAT